ncbi:MAG: DUF3006 domain-containing protein [Bacteroides sp.]|nr:DUF3006 domain-containing protein [Bacteroides sp.]
MLIIDRFEEGFAVVEDTESENMSNIDKSLIEETAKEGDVIYFDGLGYKTDKEATDRRREEVLELLRSLKGL